MLVCASCGCTLVSDGKNWECPRRFEENAHAPKNPPTVIPDKRVNNKFWYNQLSIEVGLPK